jgi:hypothetical protein
MNDIQPDFGYRNLTKLREMRVTVEHRVESAQS